MSPDPQPENDGSPLKTSTAKDLLALFGPQAHRIVAAAVFMGAGALATAGYAYLVGPVLEALFGFGGTAVGSGAMASGALGRLTSILSRAEPVYIGAAVVGVAAVKGISFFASRFFSIGAGQRILESLRASMYQGLLARNPLGAEARSPGETVSRFTVDAQMVEEAVTGGLLGYARDGLQIVALAGLAIALDPLLGLVGVAAFPAAAIMILKLGKELRRRRGAVYDSFADVGGVVEETAAGLPVIRAFRAAEFMRDRFDRKSESLTRRIISAAVLRALSSPLNEVLGALALAAAIVYANHRIGAGDLTPGELVSFFAALVLLYRPVKGLGQAQHSVQSGLAALDRLQSLTRTEAEPGAWRPPVGVPEIDIRGLTCGYPGQEPVLVNLDLSIRPGAKVAVVGPSGGGKSTLVNALMGMLPAREGTVTANGEPLTLNRATASACFAPVFQEPFLFDDDIAANVRCGRPDASDADILAACRAAGVMEFADGEEEGLATRVGRGGSSLSVGQRQRVCLARAIVSRAPVILMDEMTAAIDGETERKIVETLGEHLTGRSVLVITHRRSTAAWADEVALLENGAIGTRGPSDELLDENSRIARLFGEDEKTMTTGTRDET